MNAAEAVGSALFGLGAPFMRKDAQYILDALRAAGFAVVDATGGYSNPQDLMEDFGLAVSRDLGGGLPIAVMVDEVVTSYNSVDHVRSWAAALLAAADAAERV